MWKKSISAGLAGALALSPLAMSGCEDLPGTPRTQGAVIGGVGGAAVGAMLAKGNRLLGALIGGALGAGGGYLIGANVHKFGGNKEENQREAQRAVDKAQSDPATPADVRRAATADLNNDGFVTLDEVVAMKQAGLSDGEMLRRLEATGQVFDLTTEQENYLRDRGVSRYVVQQMLQINHGERQRIIGERSDVIGRERYGQEPGYAY